jgi:hypothetical protein
MDDYNITSLYESQNEWVARLVNILTHEIIYGFREMLKEAIKLCNNNNEEDKYLMTFQNFMARVPKWNETIIQNETQRIIESSGCNYLEDLVSCVHIIQLKCLSCIRVGQKQKKVDIDIPKLSLFIHQVYINSSRKLYKNVYLFEQKISPLEYQRNQNMLEIMIKESIINSVRDNVPVDNLLKLYLDDQPEEELTVSEEIVEERREELPVTNVTKETVNATAENAVSDSGEQIEWEALQLNVDLEEDDVNKTEERYRSPSAPGRLTFSDVDLALNEHNIEEHIQAPKNIDRLEEISQEKYIKRIQEGAQEDVEDELERIKIDSETINLESLGVIDIL